LFGVEAHENVVNCAEFSADSRVIASGSQDYTAKIWDVMTCKMTSQLTCQDSVNCVRFNPSNTGVATASDDFCVKLWDLRLERVIADFIGHKSPTTSVAFHPNGNYLVSSSRGNIVKLWDLRR